MTANEIRELLEQGYLVVPNEKLPVLPPEWSEGRRAKLRLDLQCAVRFILHGDPWNVIASNVGLGKVSRQRVYQRITRGAQFLESRGFFVKPKRGRN